MMPQVEEQEDPQQLAEDPEDLLKDEPELQNEAKALARHFLGLDKWVRRAEVIEARRQRFYWRNQQYIYWRSDAVGFIPAIGGTSISVDDESYVVSRYTDVYNIYTPYGESIISTLVQNPPGVNWQPEDPTKSEDILAAQTAEKYQQKIDSDCNRKKLQYEAARLFYTDGRTVFLTLQDEDKQSITAHGVLESKMVPVTSKCREDLVAIIISDELDVYKAKGEYPDYKNKIKEGSNSLGESAYERIARLGVLQGTKLLMQAGDAFAHMVTRHRVFIGLDGLEKAQEKYRDDLKAIFPNGMFVTFCGEQYCGSSNKAIEDHITVEFPTPGDGMNRASLGARVVPLQDVFNDELNLWHEAHDYCVPTLFMYSETGEIEAVQEQISQPGNIIPFTSLPPGATSAAEAFYAAVLEGVPATLPNLLTFIQGPLAQFITGAFPALFGGDTGDNDTAKGISIQRDAAMGRQGIPWGAMQALFAEAYRQAVTLEVENSGNDKTFTYVGQGLGGHNAAETLSVQDLKNGSFRAVPDTDSSFPQSLSAKRATYMTMMTSAERNPVLATVMSQPDNMELGHEWIGLPELVVPGAEARNKQLMEISELLREEPIPPSMQKIQQMSLQDPSLLQAMAAWERQVQVASQLGENPPPMPIPPDLMEPSIAVDPKFDFHQFEFETGQNWLSSPEKRKEELKGNLKGIQNVRLHCLQHQALIPPPPMAPTPVGPEAAKPKLHDRAEAAHPPANPQPAQPAPGAIQ